MRDFKGMKRQRGRNRGGGGGGGKPQHNANRAFDSNGPDGVKIRGAAQHVYEKYQQLARDAGSAGDRVLAENYLQHAEHYFRVLRAMQPQRPLSEIVNRDQFVSGYDIDFEDESGAAETAEGEAEAEAAEGGEQPRGDRQERFEGRDRNFRERDREYRDRDDRQRDERPREDRARDDRSRDDRQRDDRQRSDRQRDDRPREDRQRDDRPRDDRQRDDRQRDDRPRDDRPRDDRQRDDRQRDDRPRDERPREDRFRDRDRNSRDRDRDRDVRDRQEPRAEREAPARDPLGVVEPEATPLTQPREAREPRETREPREVREPAPARMLRADDGDVSHAPAFLQARPADPAAEEPAAEVKRPRRRRTPRSFEAGEGAPAPAEADEG